MADIPTTPANISYVAQTSQLDRTRNANEAIEAGDGVYLDANEWKLLSAAIVAAGVEAGIAVNSAAPQQALAVAKNGARISTGAAIAAGIVVVASATAAGTLGDAKDLVATNVLSQLGYVNEDDEIVVAVQMTGVTLA